MLKIIESHPYYGKKESSVAFRKKNIETENWPDGPLSLPFEFVSF